MDSGGTPPWVVNRDLRVYRLSSMVYDSSVLSTQPRGYFAWQVGRGALLDGAQGQRIDEGLAVALGGDAAVEHNHDAPVALAPDEAAEALLELEDGLGYPVL